ncbi:MAG: hypothetical protein KAJ92_00260 [Gammaproteobacteria bacterium]|nr:hypothetical protein [Gammaproteobacteria bacterium]MCK5262077.1 hypothetical protein [Gammaproteobacteria bacterium]
MNLFFWKKNNVIDTFANELANELFSTIQPSVAKTFFENSFDKKQMKKTEKKMEKEIQIIIKKVNQFKAVNSLGVYGKARLHLSFKERLEELGYDSSIINELNEIIMLRTP